ncbi:MAG: tetratricopeptide repeat protein [Chitinivibrionales bacterium]|nr:tetratricopeptide repeat protein [Chitinivibrionales bacterium]
MIHSYMKYVLMVVAVFIAFQFYIPQAAYGQEDKKKEELLKKLQELKKKKTQLNQDVQEKIEKTDGGSNEDVISKYERLYLNCKGKKSERCADIMYTLSKLYYDKGRDDYILARQQYEEDMKEWERNPKGAEPINPIPDYSKSLGFYSKSVTEYPEFEKADEGFYQIGQIYSLNGNVDMAKKAYDKLVNDYPNSIRASAAHFRLSEFCYLDRDFTCALKHIEKIKASQINPEVEELATYRKGEIYYNRGDFDKAVELFFLYVERCDKGEFPKRDLRDEALEYLAISFSDMPEGADHAIQFFKNKKRPYEAEVIYNVGMKNFNHGQFDQAMSALTKALVAYPMNKNAPTAQQMIVACYVIRKKYEEANGEREKLVDIYNPKSDWVRQNSKEPVAVEKARFEVRKALSQIPIYYHAEAQKKKSKELYEKAFFRYKQFMEMFPEDKWKVYEFHYNMAEIYNSLHDYESAAMHYEYVASQDLKSYPRKVEEELDTMGMEQEQIERLRSEKKKTGSISISQEDAGYNAIVAYDNLRKKKMQQQNLTEEQSGSLPEFKKMIDYIHAFELRFPKSQNTAEVLYLGGNLFFAVKDHANAIIEFQKVVKSFPNSPFAEKSMRMLANTYASAGDFAKALGRYQEILSRQKQDSPEYKEVSDLAAGAMFKKATSVKKEGDQAGAIKVYKQIASQYPNSDVADRGWFEAGVTYEEMNQLDKAAQTFFEAGKNFPKSKIRDKAFVRSSECFKKLGQPENAAKALEYGASQIPKEDFAIPSLSTAADHYKEANMFEKAGQMYEIILNKYPTDKRTPLAIYNGGLIYEKGKMYERAIQMYSILGSKFPESEYALEGFFSIGYCYEKLGDFESMAKAFTDFADKFSANRSKQIIALTRAAEAYKNMKRFSDAKKYCQEAVNIYEKFKKTQEVDQSAIAKAYFTMGEILQAECNSITLTGASEKDVRARQNEKLKILEPLLKYYASAIEIGIGEYTIHSAYNIGKTFVEFANSTRDQKLFGSSDQKTASKIGIIKGLEKYYDKALEKFKWNINTAYDQNIKNEWVDKSANDFMEIAYRNGRLFEEIGEIFKNAPIPRDLEKAEKQAYKDVLEEKYLEALDAAMPKYEVALKEAQEMGLVNQWVDSIKKRIEFINPSSEALKIQITTRPPKVGGSTQTPKSSVPSDQRPGITPIPSDTSSEDMNLNNEGFDTQQNDSLLGRSSNSSRIDPTTRVALITENNGCNSFVESAIELYRREKV